MSSPPCPTPIVLARHGRARWTSTTSRAVQTGEVAAARTGVEPRRTADGTTVEVRSDADGPACVGWDAP